MTPDVDARLIAMLERIVQQSREMQRAGRLSDPSSRREVAMLEHQLRTLQAQASAKPGGSKGVVDWSREVRAMSATTRVHTRQLRKELYRLRLITGSAPGQARADHADRADG